MQDLLRGTLNNIILGYVRSGYNKLSYAAGPHVINLRLLTLRFLNF